MTEVWPLRPEYAKEHLEAGTNWSEVVLALELDRAKRLQEKWVADAKITIDKVDIPLTALFQQAHPELAKAALGYALVVKATDSHREVMDRNQAAWSQELDRNRKVGLLILLGIVALGTAPLFLDGVARSMCLSIQLTMLAWQIVRCFHTFRALSTVKERVNGWAAEARGLQADILRDVLAEYADQTDKKSRGEA